MGHGGRRPGAGRKTIDLDDGGYWASPIRAMNVSQSLREDVSKTWAHHSASSKLRSWSSTDRSMPGIAQTRRADASTNYLASIHTLPLSGELRTKPPGLLVGGELTTSEELDHFGF